MGLLELVMDSRAIFCQLPHHLCYFSYYNSKLQLEFTS